MYPFRRIIGVEYSPQLAKICRRNLEKVELVDRCEVIIADAADFRFPAGNLLVFIYNPFDSVILTRVLQNVASSRDEVFLGQLGPGHDVIQRSGIAKVVCSGEGAILYEIAKAQGPEES
jgi:precorrin-6B methylase 2